MLPWADMNVYLKAQACMANGKSQAAMQEPLVSPTRQPVILGIYSSCKRSRLVRT